MFLSRVLHKYQDMHSAVHVHMRDHLSYACGLMSSSQKWTQISTGEEKKTLCLPVDLRGKDKIFGSFSLVK